MIVTINKTSTVPIEQNNRTVFVPIHWNDRAWEADCAECGRVVYGKTLNLIRHGIEQHVC